MLVFSNDVGGCFVDVDHALLSLYLQASLINPFEQSCTAHHPARRGFSAELDALLLEQTFLSV